MVGTLATGNGLSYLLGDVNGPLILKVHSSEHRGRILRIHSPKCTIGSHASCTLRLLCAGVRPFHCMILRGRAGVFIRRLSPNTSLNGAGFTEGWLQPGDLLNLGPIELEVLPTPASNGQPGTVPRAARRGAAPSTTNRSRDHGHDASTGPDRALSGDDLSGRPDDPRRTVESEPAGPNATCEQCRQQRQHLESMLSAHVEESNQHRDALMQHHNDLKRELKQRRSTWGQPFQETERLPRTGVEEQVTYRELIGLLREELRQLKDQYATQLAEQDRLLTHVSTVEQDLVGLKDAHEQAVTDNQKQVEQLREVRGQLDESVEQLLASNNRTAELQSRLDQAREQLGETSDTEHSLREEISQLREQQEVMLAELEADREKQRESPRADEVAEKRLQAELDQAHDALRQANERVEALRDRAAELEQRLVDTSAEEAEEEPTDNALEADKEAKARESAKWRELVEEARNELQEERESHQRVRGEWHTERESLQNELAQRSTSLRELQEKYDELIGEHQRAMREAESLIWSQQQEGQQLLTQLHEAKEALRRTERKRARLQECREARTEDHHEPREAFTTEPRGDAVANPDELDQPPSAEAGELDRVLAEGSLPREETDPEKRHEPGYVEQDATSGELVGPNPVEGERDGEFDDPASGVEPENAEQSPSSQTTAMQWSQLPDEVKSQVLKHDHETPVTQTSEGLQRHDVAGQPPTWQQQETFQPQEQAGPQAANAAEHHQPDPPLDDHEGFIQQYMDRLLKRTAPPDAPKSASSAERHWTTAVSTGNEWRKATPDATAEHRPSEPQPASPTHTEAPECKPAAEPASSKPRCKTETPNDLNKMREVANTTSREAIHRCESKKLIVRALRSLLAASVLSLLGGAAITKCSSMLGLQAMAGGLALTASGGLVLLAGFNYRRWRRVKHQFQTDHETTTRT
ncbi:MAG: hypothetical protein ACQESR_06780 [Planctomycetota bacterium]